MFLRWRIPAVPKFLASAGLGASTALALLSFLDPSLGVALSVALNVGLIAGLTDYIFLQTRVPRSNERSGNIVLSFPSNGPPDEVSNHNVHSWYATSLTLEYSDDAGQKQRRVLNQWVVSIWFGGDLHNYFHRAESLSGEEVNTSFIWRTERGLVCIVDAPTQPTVLRLSFKHRGD